MGELTPRTASRLIEIIDIRRHNELCKQGLLHGIDTKKMMIKRPLISKRIEEKDIQKMNLKTDEVLKEIQNVKRSKFNNKD